MRRFLLIAVLSVLLAGTSHAQLSMRRDSIRVEVHRQLLEKTDGTGLRSDATVNGIVNRAIQQVCDDFPAIEKLDTVALSADSVAIALNTDFLRVKWVVLNASNTWYPLIRLDVAAQDTLARIITTKAKATFRPADTLAAPYYWTSNNRIFTYPKFTKGPHSSLVVAYFAKDSALTVDASTTQVDSKYREAIIEWSVAELLKMDGMFEDATFYLRMYRSRLGGISTQ